MADAEGSPWKSKGTSLDGEDSPRTFPGTRDGSLNLQSMYLQSKDATPAANLEPFFLSRKGSSLDGEGEPSFHQQSFEVGDRVKWALSDEDIPKDSVGVILRVLSGRAWCRFPNGTFALKTATLIKAAEKSLAEYIDMVRNEASRGVDEELLDLDAASFEVGDRVTWSLADNDIPEGSIGIIVRVMPGRARCRFPGGASYALKTATLIKVKDDISRRKAEARAARLRSEIEDLTFLEEPKALDIAALRAELKRAQEELQQQREFLKELATPAVAPLPRGALNECSAKPVNKEKVNHQMQPHSADASTAKVETTSRLMLGPIDEKKKELASRRTHYLTVTADSLRQKRDAARAEAERTEAAKAKAELDSQVTTKRGLAYQANQIEVTRKVRGPVQPKAPMVSEVAVVTCPAPPPLLAAEVPESEKELALQKSFVRARSMVSGITKSEFAEVRRMIKPPDSVKRTFQATCCTLGYPQQVSTAENSVDVL